VLKHWKVWVGALVLCLVFVSGVMAASGIKLIVNGKTAQGVDIRIINGTTYLPLKAVGDLLGVSVAWDGKTKTVTVGSGGSGTTAPPAAAKNEYTVKDSTGKALYSFKINKITTTEERNQFSDKNPAQVIIIDYTYTNIANPEDLFLGDIYFKVIDATGVVGYTYPNSPTNYAQTIPAGATCNAQMIFGIDHASKSVKVNFYQDLFGSVTKSFTVPVE